MILIHLANISHRLGRTLHFDSVTGSQLRFRARITSPVVVPEIKA
jgi:hypothetical protein